MQISLREWDNSTTAHLKLASLAPGEIQVWIACSPPEAPALPDLLRTLSQDERERAHRYQAKQPFLQFVFGRTLLRQILGGYLQVEPSVLQFGYKPQGKPFLAQPAVESELQFNLSQSERMVAIALTRGRQIGIDIELMLTLDDEPLLAQRIFSSRELRELKALPLPQQRIAFFHGWTQKEAYLKATGEGLIDALPEIEVTLVPDHEPALLHSPLKFRNTSRWVTCLLSLPHGIAGAVVFEKA